MKNIHLQGGFGDVLLHTPFFKCYFKKWKKKINVFTSFYEHYQLLLNNPYIDLFLCKIEDKSVNITESSLSDLKLNQKIKNISKQYKNKFLIKKHYGKIKPSQFTNMHSCEAVASMFGSCDRLDEKPEIFLTENEIKEGYDIISKYNFPICINPSSTDKIKEWDYDKWEKIINFYPKFDFIQLGVKDEKYINGAIDFRSKFSLRQQLSVLCHSKMYIGLDSFWNHAARALDIKSVILFGPTNPKVWGYDGNINIYKKTRCSPCIDWLMEECPYGKKCMNDIYISDVKKAIDQLILEDISGFGV